MSTLDTNGMVTGYKVNRPLNEHEQQHRFNIRLPSSPQPHYDLSLVKLNSTFVECVDKWYAMRGFVAMGGAAISCFCVVALSFMSMSYFRSGTFYSASLLFLILLPLALYLFTRDAFTHYPIRFNRKNRQVYVFRRDGTVLKAGWEEIYWTTFGHRIGTHDLYVVGHVMAEDRKTIKETFALSLTSAGRAGEEKLRNHFEFLDATWKMGRGLCSMP